jgi:hypothetical protein
MNGRTCGACGTGFSGRSDAVYCSAACRQKAHRTRTARRVANLRERARGDFPRSLNRIEATALRQAVAESLVRARQQVDWSRELCRTSAERMARGAAIARRFGGTEATTAPANPEVNPWRGN